MLSPDSVASEVCAWEVEYAESLQKKIVPLVIRDVRGTPPGEISKLNYIMCRDEAELEPALELLKQALNTDIEWVRQHTDVGEKARQWNSNSRNLYYLPATPECIRIVNWAAARPTTAPHLDDITKLYVSECRRLSDIARGQKSSRRALIVLATIFLALAYLVLNYSYAKEDRPKLVRLANLLSSKITNWNEAPYPFSVWSRRTPCMAILSRLAKHLGIAIFARKWWSFPVASSLWEAIAILSKRSKLT